MNCEIDNATEHYLMCKYRNGVYKWYTRSNGTYFGKDYMEQLERTDIVSITMRDETPVNNGEFSNIIVGFTEFGHDYMKMLML